MKTLYLPASDAQTCDVAAKILREGGLVAIPTETVYGLGANGLDESAVAKIFIAKGRPQDNPLILHVADPIQMELFARDIPAEAYLLAEAFWPGPLTIVLKAKDIEMQVYRASGAGGQHVNKTSSAVRLIHKPSGIVVACQEERRQLQNREKCMRMLASKLYEIEQSRIESEHSGLRKSQVGTGMRNERIRTYNFPQGRVTAHRINLTLYKIAAVMDGHLDELIDALATADQAEKLKNAQS